MNRRPLLSILIPTHNRAKELELNLELLDAYAFHLDCVGQIEVIVSNNASTDNTARILSEFSSRTEIRNKILTQPQNVGLERNCLAVLKAASGHFVMFLGDDDYVDQQYLAAVLDALTGTANLGAIVPAFVGYFADTGKCVYGRDCELPIRKYPKGLLSLLRYSWRGHQLSGLVLRNNGLEKVYVRSGTRNLYPFVFLLSVAILGGDILHLTKPPVLVTQRPQNEKDWEYSPDGLLIDLANNYRRLPGIQPFVRWLLELKLFWHHEGRYVLPAMRSPIWLVGFLKRVFASSDISPVGKIALVLMLPVMPFKHLISRLRRRLLGRRISADLTFLCSRYLKKAQM